MAGQILKFPWKRNANGTFDLTCPFCFLTIAFGAQASEIERLERLHACWEQDRRLFEHPTAKKTQRRVA
jgi:hypothetical protein